MYEMQIQASYDGYPSKKGEKPGWALYMRFGRILIKTIGALDPHYGAVLDAENDTTVRYELATSLAAKLLQDFLEKTGDHAGLILFQVFYVIFTIKVKSFWEGIPHIGDEDWRDFKTFGHMLIRNIIELDPSQLELLSHQNDIEGWHNP